MTFRQTLWAMHSRARAELTPGERAVLYAYFVLAWLLPTSGGVLIAIGSGTRGVGVALLVVDVLMMAIPISPILRGRIRRREKQRTRSLD